jgi:hypothetical protein
MAAENSWISSRAQEVAWRKGRVEGANAGIGRSRSGQDVFSAYARLCAFALAAEILGSLRRAKNFARHWHDVLCLRNAA